MIYDQNSVWKEFEENEITHSATHYLFAIEELLISNWYARAVDISKKLDITPWSCSTWIKSLIKKWLIKEDENKFIKLTNHWDEIVEQIRKNRELFTKFFMENLNVDEKNSVINACKIEHLIWAEITKGLEKYLK